MTHFWQVPGMTYNFNTDISTPMIMGDGDEMPSPWQFWSNFQGSNMMFEVSAANTIGLAILTPRADGQTDPNTLMFPAEVNAIVNLLVGPGAPFQGLQRPFIWGYDRTGLGPDPATHAGTYRGKALLQFDPVQTTVPDPNKPGQNINQCKVQCWLEDQLAFSHQWNALTQPINQVVDCNNNNNQGGTGNQKRQNACPLPSGSGTASGGTSTASRGTATASGTDSVSKASNTASNTASTTSGGGGGSGSQSATITPSPTKSPAPKPLCIPYQDPDSGPGNSGCQCTGTTGLLPFMSNTASASSFNVCGYTTLPGSAPSSTIEPFITTINDGQVYSCASSTYYNFAVNTEASCAGASSVVSTVSSIYASYQSSQSAASASSASAASASAAAASASAAAAKPSGNCKIWDAGLYYLIEVYGINSKSKPSGFHMS